ncbi:MAG: FG-GAP repeat domain-containing protein, partial [Phycisphaerae bacterium]
MTRIPLLLPALLSLSCVSPDASGQLRRMPYNNPGLNVDLGVGLWAWPLPMDYDNDGDLDLVVSCPDKPYNGTYLFENPGKGNKEKLPVFKPAVRVGKGYTNIQVSFVDGKPRVLVPGSEITDFRSTSGRRENGFTTL